AVHRARYLGDGDPRHAARGRERALFAARRGSRIYSVTPALQRRKMRLTKQAKTAVAALEDIKGRDIRVLDVRKMTSLFDWIVIASADSARQSRALSNHLQEKMKAIGARAHSVEGERAGEWVLVDF